MVVPVTRLCQLTHLARSASPETATPWFAKRSGTGSAVLVTPCVQGWPSTECWVPVTTFLDQLAPPEAWPETDNGAVITPQEIEMSLHVLPWKAALDSSHKLASRWVWYLFTHLRGPDCEAITLQHINGCVQKFCQHMLNLSNQCHPSEPGVQCKKVLI